MDYNTEMIACIAQQVTDAFKSGLAQRLQAGAPAPRLADIENDMREVLRQIGAEALRLFLSAGHGTPNAERPCPCGGTLHYQRTRAATVTTVFGKITYTRAYYAGCRCGQGRAPVDEAYGLTPGAMSSGLAALLGLAGIELSFDESREWLRRFLLFEVSENTVRSETQTLGVLQAEQEAVWVEHSQNADHLQARRRDTARVPPRVYGSLDAAKVRIEPRPKAGKKPEKQDAWRDLKVGCWYEAEPVSPAQRSVRQREKFAREQAVFRAKNLRYYCDIAEAEAFGHLLWATGCAVKADLAPEVVFVCDGAVWIWNLVTLHYPHAVQIVDWYHAADRLTRVAHAAFTAEAERATWLEQVTTLLWEGQVEAVIRACEAVVQGCEEAQHAVTYFSNNAHRMRYDQFRAAGYLIGSGTVESGCKQIVAQRLKRSGAQWHVDGAVQTAKARAAWLSGDWDNLCARRAALPLAV